MGVPVYTFTSVENGRLKANTVQASTNKTLAGLSFREPVVNGDELFIEITVEVE